MYNLWNFWVQYSENFESEIRTHLTENFENILGKLLERLSKSIRKFLWKNNKILGSLEQISEKFVGNIWLIFLKFEKFSVIQILAYYNLKENKKFFTRLFEKVLQKNLRKV